MVELGYLDPLSPPVDGLNISACGRFVVTSQSQTPTVFEIPEAFCETHSSERNDERPPRSENAKTPPPTLSVLGKTDVSHFGLREGEVLDATCIVNQHELVVSSLVVIQPGDAPALRLVSNTAGMQSQTIELVALPESFETKHIAPVVIMPQSRDTHLRVVLNSVSHSEYSMANQSDGVVPALIERDAHLLKVTTATYNGHLSAVGETRSNEELLRHDKPMWLMSDPKSVMNNSHNLTTMLMKTLEIRKCPGVVPTSKLLTVSMLTETLEIRKGKDSHRLRKF